MRIVVVGAGGTGGYFGGLLAAAGNEVGFLARGVHLDAIRRHGLRIEGARGNWNVESVVASDKPADLGGADVVLFCVKLYDIETAGGLLPRLLGPAGFVVTLQNGVDAHERLAGIVDADRVVPGVAYVGAYIAEPGLIRYASDMNAIAIGEIGGQPSARATVFAALCNAAGFKAEVTPEIEKVLWRKFVILASNAAISSLSRLNVGHFYRDPELRELARAAMAEVVALAAAGGIALEPDLVDRLVTQSCGFPPDMTTSMHNDLKRGRRLELEHLSGLIARRGDALGVPTPIHRAAWAGLKPFVQGRG